MNNLSDPVLGILVGQFLVLVGAAGYLRRVVKDHDRDILDHDARLRELEIKFARATYESHFVR
jgi:hypothetical protein